MTQPPSLARYLHQEQNAGHLSPQLCQLLLQISQACIRISIAIGKGALAEIFGDAGTENTLGEKQKKLDLISHRILLEDTAWSGALAGCASEEMAHAYPIPQTCPHGDFLLVFDPLDGSSNIDINISVGTIFSILPRNTHHTKLEDSDFLQPGRRQIAAGYVMYGPSTMLVLTIGHGTHGFTLQRDEGSFMLTHPNLHIPTETQEFAVNASNQRHWEPAMQHYVSDLLQGKQGPRSKNFNMRWTASMVAEVHRILMRGGLFSYPWDARHPDRPGHLRLMYEANPMAMLIEQAGGQATTGHARILDIQPKALHQRIPVFLGSYAEVDMAMHYHKKQHHI